MLNRKEINFNYFIIELKILLRFYLKNKVCKQNILLLIRFKDKMKTFHDLGNWNINGKVIKIDKSISINYFLVD